MFDVVNKVIRQKLDAQRGTKPSKELDVYDVTYSAEEFLHEMRNHGFTVLSLKPVIRNFELQSRISYSPNRHISPWADRLVRLLEYVPSSNPLEWIALCRKVD